MRVCEKCSELVSDVRLYLFQLYLVIDCPLLIRFNYWSGKKELLVYTRTKRERCLQERYSWTVCADCVDLDFSPSPSGSAFESWWW